MSILEKGLSIGAVSELSVASQEMSGGNGQGGLSELMQHVGQEGGGDSWTGGNSLFGDSQDDDDDDSQ